MVMLMACLLCISYVQYLYCTRICTIYVKYFIHIYLYTPGCYPSKGSSLRQCMHIYSYTPLTYPISLRRKREVHLVPTLRVKSVTQWGRGLGLHPQQGPAAEVYPSLHIEPMPCPYQHLI